MPQQNRSHKQYPGPTASFHVLAPGHFPAEPLSVGLTALEPEPRERGEGTHLPPTPNPHPGRRAQEGLCEARPNARTGARGLDQGSCVRMTDPSWMSHADNRALLQCADCAASAHLSGAGVALQSPSPLPTPLGRELRTQGAARGDADLRPVPKSPRRARCRHRRRRQRGSCPPAAGLASRPAGPRLRPSLLPAPTCAEFVYLAAMATRGGPLEGGEKKGRGGAWRLARARSG
ncbi:unnamed protein product, partial [Rangifer tarandus platyrhynchus]